jgi:hypothetical protein
MKLTLGAFLAAALFATVAFLPGSAGDTRTAEAAGCHSRLEWTLSQASDGSFFFQLVEHPWNEVCKGAILGGTNAPLSRVRARFPGFTGTVQEAQRFELGLLSEADKARLGLPSQLTTLTPVSIVAIQAPSTGEGAVFEQEEFAPE